MDEARGLCKLPDGRDWQCEKLDLALVGRTLLSKALTQFSTDGWGCAPSLLVFLPEATQPCGLQGSMVGLMTPSKRAYAKGGISGLLLPVFLSLCWAPPDPCLHSRPSNTSRCFRFSLLWSRCSFLCVLVRTRFCVCPPRLQSLFPPVLWKSYDQILLAFKVRFPGVSQSLSWIPRLGSPTLGLEPSQ